MAILKEIAFLLLLIIFPATQLHHKDQTGNKMKLTIGNKAFTATLYDNETAKVFKSQLPMTVNMHELNGNEKYVGLPQSLPVNETNPGTIKNGDLMLYGSSTLVIFYKTFPTKYSYTKIGRIDDVTGLESALGKGNVSIDFKIQ